LSHCLASPMVRDALQLQSTTSAFLVTLQEKWSRVRDETQWLVCSRAEYVKMIVVIQSAEQPQNTTVSWVRYQEVEAVLLCLFKWLEYCANTRNWRLILKVGHCWLNYVPHYSSCKERISNLGTCSQALQFSSTMRAMFPHIDQGTRMQVTHCKPCILCRSREKFQQLAPIEDIKISMKCLEKPRFRCQEVFKTIWFASVRKWRIYKQNSGTPNQWRI